MKTIHNFCKAKQLEAVKINYKCQGFPVSRKGIDIIKPENRCILASFEPVSYNDSTGYKWCVRIYNPQSKCLHVKRITQSVLQQIDTETEQTGMYLALK